MLQFRINSCGFLLVVWFFVGFLFGGVGGCFVFDYLFLERRGCEDAGLASRSATYSSEHELCLSREYRDMRPHLLCRWRRGK